MKKVECPVLVAWGEADPWTPLSGSIGKFFTQQAKLKDNVDLVSLPNTGGRTLCLSQASPLEVP